MADDELSRLKERARIIRDATPRGGSVTPLEVTAESIEWAAAEIERLRAGIQNYLDGDYEPRLKKMDKCPHGRYGYELCEACTDAHFIALLAGGQLTAPAPLSGGPS